MLATGATYLLYHWLNRGGMPSLRTVSIVTAAKKLPAGVALKASDLELISWPANIPLPGAYHAIPPLAGRPLIYPLSASEPVLKKDLAIPGAGIGLAVHIPPGMRATSVKSNAVVGVAGFLFPGSHVDVLATFHNNQPGMPLKQPLTQTILQNVEVLTAGEEIQPDPAGKPHTVSVVTLLLHPVDAEKLLLASASSSIQFVLRNGADAKTLQPPPIRLGQLLNGQTPPPARHGWRPHLPPKPLNVVQMIQGTKRSEVKF